MAGIATDQILEQAERIYQKVREPKLFFAPGRVNLIGEHTDYNLGFVLPMALDLGCYALSSSNGEQILRFFSTQLQEMIEVPLAGLASARAQGKWSDYCIGVAKGLLEAGFTLQGSDILIDSTLPIGAGLSSSAALEAATALALLRTDQVDRLQVARICHRAESSFVGLPCGIMDQFISLLGQEGSALLIDCRSLEWKAVGLPKSCEIVCINSMVKHQLGSSEYARRTQECAEAVRLVQQIAPEVASLRDVTLELLEKAKPTMPDVIYRRARHVVTENERVLQFVDAASRDDLEQMGRLLVGSHRSLQYDYEVSCEELDFLVDEALKGEEVYGARMTGGGFGGCTINLIKKGEASQFIARIQIAYQNRFARQPEAYLCRPSAGAREVPIVGQVRFY